MASKQEPELGDLIEIFRGAYEHWAVYVGDGFVVHFVQLGGFSPSSSIIKTSAQSKNGEVRKEKLCDVVGNDEWKVNNELDKKYKPHPVPDIVKEAFAMVGKIMPYCLVSANCEHFATELRYGKAESRQVFDAAAAAIALSPLATSLGLGSLPEDLASSVSGSRSSGSQRKGCNSIVNMSPSLSEGEVGKQLIEKGGLTRAVGSETVEVAPEH